MAESALRVSEDFGSGNGFDTDIVRRLMARPIRTGPRLSEPAVPAAGVPTGESESETEAHEAVSTDVARLRSEMMVMKAVLRAERADAASVRASVERLAGPAPISPEACAVRDRWAALVDQLLDGQR